MTKICKFQSCSVTCSHQRSIHAYEITSRNYAAAPRPRDVWHLQRRRHITSPGVLTLQHHNYLLKELPHLPLLSFTYPTKYLGISFKLRSGQDDPTQEEYLMLLWL